MQAASPALAAFLLADHGWIRRKTYTKVYAASTNRQADLPNKGWPGPVTALIIPGTYRTAPIRTPVRHGDCATDTQRSTPWTPILILILIPPDAVGVAFFLSFLLICPAPGGGL